MKSTIESLKTKAIAARGLRNKEAFELYQHGRKNLFGLLSAASEIREHYKGKAISLCAIINAKSGRCAEDCAFCAQSAPSPYRCPGISARSGGRDDRKRKKGEG